MNHPYAHDETAAVADGDGPRICDTGAERPWRVLVAVGEGAVGVAGAVLSGLGCRVDTVADGDRAAVAAAACPYDLILMDPRLSGLSGVTAVDRIRGLPHPHRDAAILLLASRAETPDPDRLFAAGLDGVLDPAGGDPEVSAVLAHWLVAADDPNWGLDAGPDWDLPLLNRRTLAQLEDDLGLDLLPEVLQTYFQETARRCALLEAQVAAADATAAADQAHALKGSAGTFGALALRRAVQALEHAGRAGAAGQLAALLPEIRRLVGLTDGALRAYYASCLAGADNP